MNKTTKCLLALAVDLYTMTWSWSRFITLRTWSKPQDTQHCFYCRHTGKVLFGSLALLLGGAVYIYQDWSNKK